MRKGLLDIIEAAYRIDCDDDAWMKQIVESLVPNVADAVGFIGYRYDLNASTPSFRNFHVLGISLEKARGLMEDGAPRAPEEFRRTLGTQQCSTSSSAGNPMSHRLFKERHGPEGIRDGFFFNAVDPTGAGVLFAAGLRRATRLSARTKASWCRVAAHVAAANRLRRSMDALGQARGDLAHGAEAILGKNGKVEHVEPAAASRTARTMLTEAARRLDRARGRLRRTDPDEALEEWRGMVAARWSLVDHFDADGRRYLVARRNDAEVPRLDSLSPRERQAVAQVALGHSNKLAAYALGLSASTVSVLLWRAASKLGVRSREDLLRAFAQNPGANPGGDLRLERIRPGKKTDA